MQFCRFWQLFYFLWEGKYGGRESKIFEDIWKFGKDGYAEYPMAWRREIKFFAEIWFEHEYGMARQSFPKFLAGGTFDEIAFPWNV